MSVRKIPKNYRNVTGQMASTKSSDVLYESTLERDFFTLLEFDTHVSSYETQPLKIQWQDTTGKARTYTTDVLVHFST